MLKGLQKIKENSEEIAKAREDRQNEVDAVKLKGGDSARIRILSDGDEIVKAPFHRHEIHFASGKTFSKDIYCSGKECEICVDDQFSDESKKVRSKLLLYVFVYDIQHKSKNPEKDWKLDTNSKRYIEIVNKPMILMTGRGNGGYIENLFIEYYGKYKEQRKN